MGKLCDIFCLHLREIRPCYNGTRFYQKKYQFEETQEVIPAISSMRTGYPHIGSSAHKGRNSIANALEQRQLSAKPQIFRMS